MTDPLLLLSLVIPVYNEEEAIAPFLNRAVPAMEAACRRLGPSARFELLFVDDGSTDATLPVLLGARRRIREIEVVSLSRNFGKDAALSAGLSHASGKAVIPIDVDLQDPPEAVPALVEAWLGGAEVVNVERTDRSSDSRLKKVTATGFYRLYNALADRGIPVNVGDFRLLDRAVVDVLLTLPERTRFMKGLVAWAGFRQATVSVVREQRSTGTTKWRWWRLWNFALDGIAGSTTAPLRIWTYLCGAVATLAMLYGTFLAMRRMIIGTDVPGYTSIMVAVLFLGGLQLVSLGILGEYIGRIAAEVRGRPLYVVRSTTRAARPETAFLGEKATRDELWKAS